MKLANLAGRPAVVRESRAWTSQRQVRERSNRELALLSDLSCLTSRVTSAAFPTLH
jgi:hypothetical protein